MSQHCCSEIKPINGICFHTGMSCDVTRAELYYKDEDGLEGSCLNWLDREYYDPDTSYPYGTLRHSSETLMWTTGGWKKLKDCTPDFVSWGVARGQYACRSVHVEEEESGPLERFEKKASHIVVSVAQRQFKKKNEH